MGAILSLLLAHPSGTDSLGSDTRVNGIATHQPLYTALCSVQDRHRTQACLLCLVVASFATPVEGRVDPVALSISAQL